jgi:sulfite reductase alpha subunit-like flavoprotein
MASDVQKTLQKIAQDQGGMNENQAAGWFKDLKHRLRYQEDVW